MGSAKFLSQNEIKHNISNVQKYLKEIKVDALYLSSNDIFLNEYVPLEDCHRYYITNFTGSTAESLITKSGAVYLFVDGRYFEQADLEVDASLVFVVKVDMSKGLKIALLEKIQELKIQDLAIEGDRTDLNLASILSSKVNLHALNHGQLHKVIQFKQSDFNKKILNVGKDLTGETTLERLQRILKPNEAFYISALDSIAWLTNLRRYEMPNQSTFRSRALATYERVYLLMETLEGEIENESVEVYLGSFNQLEVFLTDISSVEKLLDSKNHNSFEKIFYSDASITVSDFETLKRIYGEDKLINKREGIVSFHAIKNATEILTMKKEFNLADTAIFNTISWVKNKILNQERFSELDFYHQCDEFYKAQGAFEQSFKTIAGFGPNSSIIHFSNPSDEVLFTPNELALLDSGGYFASGYATDTTRTFLSGTEANKEQKKIYTLVLKSLLHGLNVVFPENTVGAFVDGVIRQPMQKFGLDYRHGTGHGVGVNVHEGGFRIGPASMIPLKENTVGSIEPGIYIPGMGGVRLENVVVVKKHPCLEGMLCFESLVYVGFDHDLIEFELLTNEEKNWLDLYEAECEKRGRSFLKK